MKIFKINRALTTCLILLLISCSGSPGQKQTDTISGQNNSYESGQLLSNSKTELTGKEDDPPTLAEGESDNPFSTVVAEYTPEQIKQLLGKSAPENVKDLFPLLSPEDIFFGLKAEERKQLVKQKKYVTESGSMTFLVNETETGENYLSFIGTFEGIWEMFAKKKGDTWWIAVNSQFCGALCYTHIANCYTFHNNRLTLHTDANLAGYQDVWPELFIDFDQLTADQQETVKKIWDKKLNELILFNLPRDGKTITMYIDELPYLDEDIPYEVFKKVETDIWE
ncbi:MAG: hypothetical protein GXZ19_11465 [Bacteroidales bacterium]|nr:hypothetical protein [Bacteroidales bacterium]